MPRQDSTRDQMMTAIDLANEAGCYDAVDVMRQWVQPGTASVIDTLRSDLARVTSERDAARDLNNKQDARILILTEELRVARVDASTTSLQADGYRRERDTARSEVARLTAEVEAMRLVVEAARAIRTTWNKGSTRTREEREHANLDDALRALDALRARKVGG